MLQTILKIIFYVPVKIHDYFYDIKSLRKDNRNQALLIRHQQLLLKRIINESEYYMQMNPSISYAGFQKIKSLASTFPINAKLD